MNLILLAAPVVIIIMVMSFLKIFMILVKRSLKLKLTLDPEEVDKGAPVRIIITAEPQKPGHLNSLEGHLLCKKFDGYKGSWLERQDIPFISPGVVLSRIKFSYGENIELTPEEENKHIGIIAIPDDAEHTEYRGALQVHWFIQVRAHLGILPPIVLEDELIVLRPVIYSGERLAFEEKKSDTSGADFYDPGFDLEEERMKPVEILAKKKTPDTGESPQEPAGARIDVDGKEKPKISIAPPPQEKTPYIPPAPKGDKSDLLRVQFKTPFMPKQNDQVLTDVRDLYREPSPSHPQMRAPQTTAFTPGKLPESYPGAPGAEEENKGELLKVQYKTPWQPAPPSPGEEPFIYGQEPAEPSTGPQFRTPWRPDAQTADASQGQVQSGPQYSKAPWRPDYAGQHEAHQESYEGQPAAGGPQFRSPWRQKQQEAEPVYQEEYPQEGYPQEEYPQEGYPQEGYPQEEYPESSGWQPQTGAMEVQRAEEPFGGYEEAVAEEVYPPSYQGQEYQPPRTAGYAAPREPVGQAPSGAAKPYSFKNPWKPGSKETPAMAEESSAPGREQWPSANEPQEEPAYDDVFASGQIKPGAPKPMGIRTRSPFRSDSPHKVEPPVFGQSESAEGQISGTGRRSTTPLKKKVPGIPAGKTDSQAEPAKLSPLDKFKTGEKPTLGAKPALGEKPALKSTGSFAKLPRTFDLKRPGGAAPPPPPPSGAPAPPSGGATGAGKIPLPSMGLKRAPFKPKDS